MSEQLPRVLMRNGAMRTVAFFVNVIASLVLMPFLIHGLGERSYGMWATIGTVVAYYNVLDFGLIATNERFMARSLVSGKARDSLIVFATAIVSNSGLAIFFSIFTLIISIMSPVFFSEAQEIHQFRYTFLILGLNFSLSFPFYAIQGALAARLLHDKIAVAQIVSTIFRTLAAILAVNAGYSLIAVAFVILTSSMLFRILLLAIMRRNLSNLHFSLSNFSRPVFLEMFQHGKYVFLGQLSSNAHFRLSNVIVTSVAGLSAVTVYAVASRLSEYLQSLVQRVFQVFLPVFTQIDASDTPEDFDRAFWATFELNIVSTACLFGLAIVFGENFIRLWLGPGFESSYSLFLILSCGLALKQMQESSLQALMARSRHKNNNLYELAESACAILLAILLGQRYGLQGIAFGIVVPMVVNKALLQPTIRCRDLGLNLRRYYLTLLKCSLPAIPIFLIFQLILRELGELTLVKFVLAFFTCLAMITPIAFFSLSGGIRQKLYQSLFPSTE